MILPEITEQEALDNLHKIDHIVVLMLENRSFDHMLGYLSLEANRTDIEGLRSNMKNTYNGKDYAVHRLSSPRFPSGEDPCHEGQCVAEQITNDNGGFVENFAHTFPKAPDPGIVMGYYFADALPVYDQFASDFVVCDHWFASVPGQTWPNRLYAVAGRCDGLKENLTPPIYNIPSFPRKLDEARVSWKWYSHDITTLRLTDDNYFTGHNDKIRDWTDFLSDASSGNLASVTWIDPLFAIFGGESHDDHPPSTIEAGQTLAFRVYAALANSPQWDKTMLLVVYDEHGGIFDHVPPVKLEDDNQDFRLSGLRVPAMVVSPWVEPAGVSKIQFDHTSIIKTIFMRFCRDEAGRIPPFGVRTASANHLGHVLTRTSARPAPNIQFFNHLAMDLANRAQNEIVSDFITHAVGAVPSIQPKNELQLGLLRAQEEIVRKGHPLGTP